jgi:hypothetical protein
MDGIYSSILSWEGPFEKYSYVRTADNGIGKFPFTTQPYSVEFSLNYRIHVLEVNWIHVVLLGADETKEKCYSQTVTRYAWLNYR